MSPELIQLLSQVPLVGIFVYFVLTILQRQGVNAKENHTEWRDWLREERIARQAFSEEQNRLIVAGMERMSERIVMLENRRIEERAETMVALRAMNESMEHLSAAIEKMVETQPRSGV